MSQDELTWLGFEDTASVDGVIEARPADLMRGAGDLSISGAGDVADPS